LGKLFEGAKVVKGIKFVIDDAGQKKAVLIDIKKHKETLEDFYDAAAGERAGI
jgi:hypothetical protein